MYTFFKPLYFCLLGISLLVLLGASQIPTAQHQKQQLSDDWETWGLEQLFQKLGRTPIAHQLEANLPAEVSAQKGKELVTKGYTTDSKGKKTPKLSKFFSCIACHNTVKEFEDPAEFSPDKRLDYAIKNRIPFLQGSSFYGIVNRTSFYNDDYQVKYKNEEGIKEAQSDLRNAIQFCATVCSQGRRLEEWEQESILAYFWELQIPAQDLKLSDAEKKLIKSAIEGQGDKADAIQMLENKYVRAYPAHFTDAPHFEPTKPEWEKDAKRIAEGKAIFELGCQHCHLKKQFSFYSLDNSKLTFKHLENATRTHNHIYSMYLLAREGLPPRLGRPAYMPQYSLEKMSKEQLTNIYVYVKAMSK